MKKSMRMAALLLAGSLATTAFVGGTFAKYVTSGTGTDSARVAKFGVEVTANGNLFNAEYAYADTNTSGNSVVGKDTTANADVVAPGTSGELTKMTLSGTPEVAVRVSYAANLELKNWVDKDSNVYCPIEIKVGDTTYKIDETNTSTALLETAVENVIAAYTKDIAAGTDLSGETGDAIAAPVVSWSWPTGEASEKDTYLGDQAATGTAATIKLEITTTVTQID